MRVLSIKEPFASLICLGKKRIETRSFKTNYRGKLYIHASLKNHAKDDRYEKGRYAWVITDVKKIDRLPAKGKLGIWNY